VTCIFNTNHIKVPSWRSTILLMCFVYCQLGFMCGWMV